MSTARATIGIGSNLGDRPVNVRAAQRALARLGRLVACSRLYRSAPWGKLDQPDFCNAVVVLETVLSPERLLGELKRIEGEFGRRKGPRWGPRVIDLDMLLYDDMRIDQPDLQVPHPRMHERAFVLIPLAEVDRRFAHAAAGLPREERESVALMFDDELVGRVRTLAQAFLATDLMRLRIEEPNSDAVEFRRKAVAQPATDAAPASEAPAPAQLSAQLEPIKADLVGIFHLSRPPVREGEWLEGDRELAYVEALGIRNPVRSFGSGRLASVLCREGEPVEYGEVLFEIDRG